MLFFKSYLNICKDLILYWIICESIDFYKESKKNKINIINFLIYDIITDFILSIIIYSIIYFFKISLLAIYDCSSSRCTICFYAIN